MMLSGLLRRGSTMRARICASLSRAALRRSGARVALKALLRKRPAVAQKAQSDLPVGDQRPAPGRIAFGAGQGGGHFVVRKN
jgi:hypothetical protein